MRRILVAIMLSAPASAQGQPIHPAFEVASVKLAGGDAGGPRSIDLQQVRYTGVRMSALIQDAYEVKRYQINGPDWLNTQRYDLIARLPGGATSEQIPVMLRNLLAERFHMKIHMETRQDRVYALVVAKNGPRLKESDTAMNLPVGLEVHGGRIEFRSVTLEGFSGMLSSYLGDPVLDMTGLAGHFDITLTMEGGPPNTIPDTNFSSSVISALQELGLKLESRIAPIQHVVVDTAERIPTGD